MSSISTLTSFISTQPLSTRHRLTYLQLYINNMPALSSNIDEKHYPLLNTAGTTAFIALFVALVIVLIRRKLLFGSIFLSSSQYQTLKMSAPQNEESEKSQSYSWDENAEEGNEETPDTESERTTLVTQATHARSLSSQLPPPTLKPYLPPISSASNAEYFSSPVSETPGSTFSPSGTFSQSTSFSESPETSQEGQTRRRSYTKTLSLPLPNQAIPHPSSNASFPTPTSQPASEAYTQPTMYAQPIAPGPMYLTGEKIVEVEVQGEIIVAEGWRRHTRVFGGGVCKACEESKQEVERRGTA